MKVGVLTSLLDLGKLMQLYCELGKLGKEVGVVGEQLREQCVMEES